MYEVCARINNVGIKKILLTQDFNLDPQKFLDQADEETKIIFICSPNNPTANSFREQHIIKILDEFNGIVAIDEAYIDFASHKGFLKYLETYPNLIILQTFSKAWGMAGIRLGVGFGNPELINVLNRMKYPYNVSLLTQQTALEMLERGSEVEMWVRSIIEQRKCLEGNLRQLSFVKEVYPSDANFLLVRVNDPVSVCRWLGSSKLIVRNRSNLPLCENCIRITVGTAIENKMLIDNMIKYQTEINTSGI
jgi:histidinol-phosphate aminotransferase